MKLAIVPGSFDPMTLGHLDLIRTVAGEYDKVVVAVMKNSQKQYLLTDEERVAIAQRTVAEIENAEVILDHGMLIDLFDRLDASAVCKGWRTEEDLIYEQSMADWNREHNPRFVTRLFRSKGTYATLSSTQVRELLDRGESPSDFVHPSALPILLQAIKNKKGESI
ncbi:MAG: pantetheine-phosphate adenylyltransferase [Clostridia bacterium]|nr:pantetheine-phosphate adenylyltransferase [Clostridia bacterium]